MKVNIKNTALRFKSLWSSEASDTLMSSKAVADKEEATKLMQELPTKLQAQIDASRKQTQRIIDEVILQGEVSVLHLKRQAAKRESDLKFIIANAKLELGE